MSELSFFLSNPQAAWITHGNHQAGESFAQNRERIRKLFFCAMPDENSQKSDNVPSIGSQVSLIQGAEFSLLGSVATYYDAIDGISTPVKQVIEIDIDQEFFNDIFQLRALRLHLHVSCGTSLTNEDDLKELLINSFRISLLPAPAPKARKLFIFK